MIKGIAHLAFGVRDMKKSIDFYTKVMGFEKAFSLADEKGMPMIEYIRVSPGNFIELFYDDPTTPHNLHPSYQHFCLETDDIQKFVETIFLHQYPLDQPISMGLDHNWQCWIKDPDGNRIEIMEYGKDSLQLASVEGNTNQ